MNKDTLKSKKRYDLIDSIRGFAVINMVAFHALYDIFIIYGDGSAFTNSFLPYGNALFVYRLLLFRECLLIFQIIRSETE